MSTTKKPVGSNPITGYILGTLLLAGGAFVVYSGYPMGWAIVGCGILFLPFVWRGISSALPMRELGTIRGILALGVVVMGALPLIKGTQPENGNDLTRGEGGPPPDMNELEKAADPAQGRYVALLFAAEAYKHWPRLNRPIDDAEALKTILTKYYAFKEEDVLLVKDPSRADMIGQLDALSGRLSTNDNLLIYYAGHGAVRKSGDEGSWIPIDGEEENSADWVAGDDIVSRLRGLPARHVLLMVDACFGGSILERIDRTRSGAADEEAVNKYYNLQSRKAMTSGASEEVSDSSPFMHVLRFHLESFHGRSLLASQLFGSVRDSLDRTNYKQVPQFSNIASIDGNTGGDFVFVRKDR